MSRSSNDAAHKAAQSFIEYVLMILNYLLFGVFLLSEWVTALFLKHVVNPLTQYALDRYDGAVVFASTLLWSALGGSISLLASVASKFRSPIELLTLWQFGMLIGALWGIAVGTSVLTMYWQNVESQPMAGYDVVQLLDRPLEITSSSGVPTSNQTEPSLKQLEQMILEETHEKNNQ